MWIDPPGADAVLALAHGAGSGMRTPFMAGFAEEIGSLGVATLRFEFPYMQAGRRAPVSSVSPNALFARSMPLGPEGRT